MLVIRPITHKDQNIFSELPVNSLLGMTNLPINQEKLLKKILHSELSFEKQVEQPGQEEYYFVLHDLKTNRLGGTCGILAQSMQSFNYCYRIETLVKETKYPFTSKEMKVLRTMFNPEKTSEVCALYLHPTFRHSGLGRLLSLSRFLFIASHPQRFAQKIIAEMRGYIDSQQNSPFWESIGHHFCHLSFTELMEQINGDNKHFLKEILPQYPIYIDLLSQEAQASIGQTHDNTKPALQMLLQENFSFNQEVDILEGGPILSALKSEIRTIKNSRFIHVDITSDPLTEEKEYLLANKELFQFRACLGKIKFLSHTHGLINKEVAQALLISQEDQARYITLH